MEYDGIISNKRTNMFFFRVVLLSVGVAPQRSNIGENMFPIKMGAPPSSNIWLFDYFRPPFIINTTILWAQKCVNPLLNHDFFG